MKLPGTAEEAATNHYGEESVEKLARHYGSGDTPIVHSDQLTAEWYDLRNFMIRHYSGSKRCCDNVGQ